MCSDFIGGITDALPDNLQEVEIPVITNYDCSYRMRYVNNGAVNCWHICVFDSSSGSCQVCAYFCLSDLCLCVCLSESVTCLGGRVV